MIYVAFGLLFFGAALLIAEVFAPGFGVCGISGILALILSAVITVFFVPFGAYIVIGEAALLAASGVYFIRYIKRKQVYSKIVLNETLDFDKEPGGDLRFYIGKEGITKTPLKPVGNADFNGSLMEVYSEGGYIEENVKVKVVDVLNKKIIVKQVALQKT